MATRPHATTEEQIAALGKIKRKPAQIDMFTGELVVKPVKKGSGSHIKLHDQQYRPVGMAHFPGTGPERTYCKDCAHCVNIDVYRGGRMRKPSSKPGEDVVVPLRVERDACVKAARMLDDMVQRGGIGSNRSCKYFEPKAIEEVA